MSCPAETTPLLAMCRDDPWNQHLPYTPGVVPSGIDLAGATIQRMPKHGTLSPAKNKFKGWQLEKNTFFTFIYSASKSVQQEREREGEKKRFQYQLNSIQSEVLKQW